MQRVHQGSVMGLLLFLVYISALSNCLKSIRKLFADISVFCNS